MSGKYGTVININNEQKSKLFISYCIDIVFTRRNPTFNT